MPNPLPDAIILDDDIKHRLQKLADEAGGDAEALARKALADFVEREELRRQFDKDTIESLEEHRRTGLHVTDAEMEAWFDRIAAGDDVDPPACHT